MGLPVLCMFKNFLQEISRKQSILITTHVQSLHLSGFLSQEGRGVPLEAVCHSSGTFAPPKIWSENNRKISITKQIYITIDFAS